MTLDEHQQWLHDFYAQRGWDAYSPFVGLNFMVEEVGELARAVRTIEIGRDHPGEKAPTTTEQRANLEEELADVLDQILFCCSKYDIDASRLLQASEDKLTKRFAD